MLRVSTRTACDGVGLLSAKQDSVALVTPGGARASTNAIENCTVDPGKCVPLIVNNSSIPDDGIGNMLTKVIKL